MPDPVELSPGPWRLAGAPNYRNVLDANGAAVCAVSARGPENGGPDAAEINARALAEAWRAVHAVRDALRTINAFTHGDRPAVGEIDQITDELAAIVAAVFGNANAPASVAPPSRGVLRTKAAKVAAPVMADAEA